MGSDLCSQFQMFSLCDLSRVKQLIRRSQCPGTTFVAAAIGRMMLFEGVAKRTGPVYAAVSVGTHGAAQATLVGVLAQLIARRHGSLGQRQQSTILRALTSYDLVALGVSQLDESPFPLISPLAVKPILNLTSFIAPPPP